MLQVDNKLPKVVNQYKSIFNRPKGSVIDNKKDVKDVAF